MRSAIVAADRRRPGGGEQAVRAPRAPHRGGSSIAPVSDLLLDRPAPYVIGIALGLTVVGVLGTMNREVGALGGYSAAVERVSGRTPALGWQAWFLLGIVLGSLVFRLLAGDSTAGDGYGSLTRTFEGGWQFMVGVLLLVAGVLIGFGAKRRSECARPRSSSARCSASRSRGASSRTRTGSATCCCSTTPTCI